MSSPRLYRRRMRAAALVVSVFLSASASAQQAPPCTKELVGVLFDFGTPQAPRLFKCDGRTWAVWTPPASLCAPASAEVTPSPPPGPPPAPPLILAPPTPEPSSSPAPLPPLPTGPKAGTDVVANADCRKACTVAFTECVRSRCGTSLAASCKQSCDKQQTRCASACP